MNMPKTARALYFAVWYNTTSLVNVMLTLGVVVPYVALGVSRHTLSATGVVSAVALTLLATYCYNLVYIINDYIDHDKDLLLGTPKLTARHILGERYLWIVFSCFAAIIGLGGLIYPGLLLPLLGYCAILATLSVLHSTYDRAKLLTIFVERLGKFCMPLVFILVATGQASSKAMLAAALLIFPLSHTLDYAYRGYIRDRLGLPQKVRFAVYAGYYATLAAGLTLAYGPAALSRDFGLIIAFIAIYGAIGPTSDLLAKYLPLPMIDAQYTPHVAGEKRRLLTYGFIQAAVLTLGGIYALLG